MTAPVHNQILRKDLVSADVNTKLTIFALQLLNSFMGLQDPEVVQLGMSDTTAALNYKMPISVGTPLFQKIINGIKYRRLGELILPVSVADWADGVAAEVKKIQSDDWTGWGMQPAAMAAASKLIAEYALAQAIEAGETTASVENYVDGDTTQTAIKVFAKNKPCDPLGGVSTTYDNLFTGGTAAPLTMPNIDVIWQAIATQKAQNGRDFRNLKWKYVLVGKDLELKARRYFEDQGDANNFVREQSGSSTADVMVANTAKKYGIKVIASPYLTQAGVWYPIAVTPELDVCPWITLTQIPANQVPLIGNFPEPPAGASPLEPGFEWIIDGLDSELYKHGSAGAGLPAGYVAIAAKRSVGVAITTPWAIFKCKPS